MSVFAALYARRNVYLGVKDGKYPCKEKAACICFFRFGSELPPPHSFFAPVGCI